MSRRPHPIVPVLALLAACGAAGCRQLGIEPPPPDPDALRESPDERREPAHVVVQHVLVAFEGARIDGVTRTLEEAERLAADVLARARGGEDFGVLVARCSDDRRGDGTYAVANWGVPATARDEVERASLVRSFGDVAFGLEVGEVGIAVYDPVKSPLGWHVVRRLR